MTGPHNITSPAFAATGKNTLDTARSLPEVLRDASTLSAKNPSAVTLPAIADMARQLARATSVSGDLSGFRDIQARLDDLRTLANQEGWEAPSASRPEAKRCQAEIDKAQTVLDASIAASMARFSGNALKEAMKTIYPDPARLAQRASRILPLAQQRDLANASRKLQRQVGMGAHPDLHKLSRIARGTQSPPQEEAAHLFLSATWASDDKEQISALKKLTSAFQGLPKKVSADELPSALQPVIAALENLHHDEGASRAVDAVIAAIRRSAALQEAFLQALRPLAVQAEKEAPDLPKAVRDKFQNLSAPSTEATPVHVPLAIRINIAKILASLYTDEIENSPEFAAMRHRFINDEVRDEVNSTLPPVEPFNADKDIVDLRQYFTPWMKVKNALKKFIPAELAIVSFSHTRHAFMIEIKGTDNRAKQGSYGARVNAIEYAATNIHKVLGGAAPKTQLAHVGGIPDHLASQVVPGYQDVGDFLLDEKPMKPLLEKEWGQKGVEKFDDLKQVAATQTERLARLMKKKKPKGEPDVPEKNVPRGTVYDSLSLQQQDANAKRFHARLDLLAMTPNSMRQDSNKGYALRQPAHDVDAANFQLANNGWMGNGKRAVHLDLANTLGINFGGEPLRIQDDPARTAKNIARSSSRARRTDPYDPPESAENDRFGPNIGPAIVNTGRTARALPSAAAQAESIRAQADMFDLYGALRDIPAHEIPRVAGYIEAAYTSRMVIDDFQENVKAAYTFKDKVTEEAVRSEVLRRVVARYMPEPDDPKVPHREGEQRWPALEETRKNLTNSVYQLADKFSSETLARWEALYPERAQAAYEQTAAAIADMTGVYVPARKSLSKISNEF